MVNHKLDLRRPKSNASLWVATLLWRTQAETVVMTGSVWARSAKINSALPSTKTIIVIRILIVIHAFTVEMKLIGLLDPYAQDWRDLMNFVRQTTSAWIPTTAGTHLQRIKLQTLKNVYLCTVKVIKLSLDGPKWAQAAQAR
jgi:hypothetical protein